MNLIIVDADCKFSCTEEQIRSCFPSADLTVWYLDDLELMENEYDLCTVTGSDEPYAKVLLLTRLSHGIMGYHRKLVEKNSDIHCWVVTMPDCMTSAEKKQMETEINGIFYKKNTRYVVLSDDMTTWERTSAVLQEKIPEKPQCAIFFNEETSVTRNIMEALKIEKPDWEVLCNPENRDWVEKYADKILLFPGKQECFESLSGLNHTGRIYVWTEAKTGAFYLQEKAERIQEVMEWLKSCNLSLIQAEEQVLYGLSELERFQAEIKAGKNSYMALKNNENFVMWDEYGLPLCDSQYDEENIKDFLDRQSVLKKLIES